MGIGITYLRPIPVVRVRGYGTHGEAAKAAWDKMLHWLDVNNYRVQACRGFGLVYKAPETGCDAATYDACIEFHTGMRIDPDSEIGKAHVAGGPYLRLRHSGDLDALGPELRRMRVEETARRGIDFDSGRPIIEVYLNDFKRTGEAPKIDLCVPVRI